MSEEKKCKLRKTFEEEEKKKPNEKCSHREVAHVLRPICNSIVRTCQYDRSLVIVSLFRRIHVFVYEIEQQNQRRQDLTGCCSFQFIDHSFGQFKFLYFARWRHNKFIDNSYMFRNFKEC
jgi:hypothetical protein